MKTYKELYTLVEQQVQLLNYNPEPKELYDPISYMLSLGGKRLRPVLVLMGNDLFGGHAEDAIHAALAVELFHNFTLVHDDIMDKANIRRGQPTVHVKWNETVAILSGDLMMIKATEILCETETKDLKSLMMLFNKTATEVCEGQQVDMNFESRNDVTVNEYLDMITLKTAVLLGCSLKLGAMIAGANEADAHHVYEFGKNIGVAFQIQDDILDSFGDGDKVGKKIGGDIAANKKTLLLIQAQKDADANTAKELSKWLATENDAYDTKIKAVLEIYNKLNVSTEAERLKEEYLQTAFTHLDSINLPAEKKQVLKETAVELMQRIS